MSPRAESTVESAVEILDMLKDDHNKVKELFDQFEQTDDAEERAEIIKKAIQELEVHAEIEEKILYPAFRQQLQEEDLIDEAFEEHHVVHLLIKELKGSRVKQQGRRHAKFMVLAENVKHHIKEEEGSLFPEVEGLDLEWEALSAKVEKKRAQLESGGRRSKG